MDQTEMLELSREFASLAAQIAGPGDNQAASQRMVDLAVKTVDGCRYATVSVLRGRHGQVLAASDETGQRLERLQNELDDGPSLAAARLGEDIVVRDLAAESRWPRFADLAVRATGISSVLAFRLAGAHQSVLTFYGDGPAGFDDEAMHTATIFAAQAASLVALVAAEDHSATWRQHCRRPGRSAWRWAS